MGSTFQHKHILVKGNFIEIYFYPPRTVQKPFTTKKINNYLREASACSTIKSFLPLLPRPMRHLITSPAGNTAMHTNENQWKIIGGLECQSGANCDWMNGNNYEKGCPWKSHVIWQPEWKSEWKSDREVAKFHPSWNNHTTSCTMHENKFTSGQHFKDDIQNTLVSRLGEENNCISIRRWLENFFLFLFFLSRLCISFLQE